MRTRTGQGVRWGRLALVMLCAAAVWSGAARAATIWVEGESPTTSTMSRHPWWYDQVHRHELSGGDWMSHFSEERGGEVAYRFQVAEDGEYHFWLRANAVKASLAYSLNDGPWTPVDMSAPIDNRNIAADGRPDLRFIAWLDMGPVTLSEGVNTIAFRTDGELPNHGAIDCFTFTTEEFAPRGRAKPGEPGTSGPVEEGKWAFTPDPDRYSPESLLDLRHLNEVYAGEHGFIRLSEDGRGFVRGDGEPIRFWAVNTGVWEKGPAALGDNARFLAKRGVNLVRWHGNVPAGEGSKLTDINEDAREKLWQFVAAMKAEGIYMTISPYYPHATRVRQSWGIDSPQDNMTCLLFFEPRVQGAYKAWLRAIFEPANPHTGVPLKDEPAVAIVQVQNEDSMLFWTMDAVKGGERALLERKFGDWLKGKYGSLEAASRAWQGEAVDGDDFAAGRAGLYITWEFTRDAIRSRGPAGPGKEQRLADQLQFYTEGMRDWHAEVVRFLREELGSRQLVNAGNWRPADLVALNDAERYSCTSTEVMGVNRYYTGGQHVGPYAGWAIVNGDRFTNRSLLLSPRELPTNLKQVAGHPMIIPESSWVPPLGYQSEGPFLISVFQSLGGVDAFYWFAMGEPQWRHPYSANGYLPSIGKWVCHTPELMGNFPAAALLYRKGYVERGRTVVHEVRSLDDLWLRRTPAIAEDPGFDPNRDAEYRSPQSAIGGVTPLAFLVGPVEVTYGRDPAESRVINLAPYLDEGARVVKSVTGQVEWDYGRGICALNAPKAQGVTGFLSKVGKFELGDVTVESGNDYATVMVVSMDGEPLSSSGKVLVQVGTVARPTGWQDRPVKWADEGGNAREGFEVVSYGEAPWQIVDADVKVTVRNPGLSEAVALDMNGLPRGQVEVATDGGALTLQLPRDAKYVILR